MDYLKAILEENLISPESQPEDKILLFPCFLENDYKISDIEFYIKNRSLDYEQYKVKAKEACCNVISQEDGRAIINELNYYKKPILTFHYPSYRSLHDFSPLLLKDRKAALKPLFIIVPDTITGPINLTNIEYLLKNRIYKPIDLRASYESLTTKSMKYVYENQAYELHFISDISQLKEDEIKLIICVFLESYSHLQEITKVIDIKQFDVIAKYSVQFDEDFEDIGENITYLKLKSEKGSQNRIYIDFLKLMIKNYLSYKNISQ